MDFATSKGLWLLPSFNRPTTNLPKFFATAIATGMTTPGAVLVDTEDYASQPDAYDALALPENWSLQLVKGGCIGAALREGYAELCDGLDWVGLMSDDMVPVTVGWDRKVIEALTGWNFVSTDDGRTAPKRMTGATAISGDLLRAVGYLLPDDFNHMFGDDVWEELGRMMNCWTVLMDVMVRHDNAMWKPGDGDKTTQRANSFWEKDEKAFGRWKNNERLASANRIGELLKERGVAQEQPDLSHVRVLIATPSGDGKYESLYTTALFGTIALLRQLGAQVNFSEMKYCSDIALARNKIFGAFLRSDATHMMSIDADMGWNPQAVVQLFLHKKDYVAVAGPRKVFPESFAVQNSSPQGKPIPMRQESTGLFEVSHVGMAFALVTKHWAHRLASAYADLEFSGDDGRTEYAVFNPMVVNRRYMSEDYSACERWRAVGGKVYVDPNISLQHVGTFVWEGAWMNHLIATANKQQVAA